MILGGGMGWCGFYFDRIVFVGGYRIDSGV